MLSVLWITLLPMRASTLEGAFIGLRKYSQKFVIYSVLCDFDWSYRSYHKLTGLDI